MVRKKPVIITCTSCGGLFPRQDTVVRSTTRGTQRPWFCFSCWESRRENARNELYRKIDNPEGFFEHVMAIRYRLDAAELELRAMMTAQIVGHSWTAQNSTNLRGLVPTLILEAGQFLDLALEIEPAMEDSDATEEA